ncbi:MAG: hypothetical protein MMC33_000387 [Icmadophila ericetorum]|nr:hypothetical protein [Icmadophila ericetorum]
MTTSPTRHSQHPPLPSTAHLNSPRSTRTLRKLQSAYALSSNYNNGQSGPGLITQQRQLSHSRSGLLRGPSQQLDAPPPAFPPFDRRTRANSDAEILGSASSTGVKRGTGAKKTVAAEGIAKEQFENLIRHGPKGDVRGSLNRLRYLVLSDGLDADSDGMSHHRIYVWLILLNCPPLPTDTYLELIHRGPGPAYSKIRNDTFRTLATDPLFKRRVTEASLIRLLNSLSWTLHDLRQPPVSSPSLSTSDSRQPDFEPEPPASPLRKHSQAASVASSITSSSTYPHAPRSPNPDNPSNPNPASSISNPQDASQLTYIQGLNVLSAPLLYASRSEAQAFTLLRTLLLQHLPAYILPTMPGVHRGLALVATCLQHIDPKLAVHLQAQGLTPQVYAFPSVLTLCACTPPLPEVLILWDFLLAYGVHMNILMVVAQLILMRDELMGQHGNHSNHPLPASSSSTNNYLYGERDTGLGSASSNARGRSGTGSTGAKSLTRGFPPLRAREVINMAVSFVGKVPARVFGEVVGHAQLQAGER